MPQREPFDVLILGSGQGGKLLAWNLAHAGRKVAAIERQWVGGSCPAVACMPSKNEIWSARVAYLAQHAADFGTLTGSVQTDMAKVRRRKQDMIEREIAIHLNAYKESGTELIMGTGQFVAPKTIEVALNGAANACSPASMSWSTSDRTLPFPTSLVSQPLHHSHTSRP
jgi:pyruvate/2-oxoglutarate dehydrogenase complex dihydrolipoamide dehydrogenase (E3) component